MQRRLTNIAGLPTSTRQRPMSTLTSSIGARQAGSYAERSLAGVRSAPRIEIVDLQNLGKLVDHRLGAKRVPSQGNAKPSRQQLCGAIFSEQVVWQASRCCLPDSQTKRQL
jgi:hypothetical protein